MNKHTKVSQLLAALGLVIILALIPVLGTSCSTQKQLNVISSALAETQVPDIDLDLYGNGHEIPHSLLRGLKWPSPKGYYLLTGSPRARARCLPACWGVIHLYFKQETPTVVPSALIDTAADIAVDSLAIWGIVKGSDYSIGGALNFSNAADANTTYSLLPSESDVWTKLSDSTIYVVYGAGAPFESLKSAISNNNFKKYDDKKALNEVTALPYGDSNRPLMIGILNPNQEVIKLIKQYTDSDVSQTLDSISTWVKPQVITIGLYASRQIDIADIQTRLDNDTLWDMQLGVIASVSSAYPGIIFGPIAEKFLDSNGYQKISLENLTVYQTQIDNVDNKTVPVLINVSGNHIFAATSTNPDYTKTLMTGIKR